MVRQLKRSESIARTLVDRITSSKLKDGDSLESEIVMMEELNTGRGSLRGRRSASTGTTTSAVRCGARAIASPRTTRRSTGCSASG